MFLAANGLIARSSLHEPYAAMRVARKPPPSRGNAAVQRRRVACSPDRLASWPPGDDLDAT